MDADFASPSESTRLVIEMLSVPVSKFRANISQILDELGEVYKEITLTKNGKVIAHILPPKYLVPSFEGRYKDIIHIPDEVDIDKLSAFDDDWEEQMAASWERSTNYRQYMAKDSDTQA